MQYILHYLGITTRFGGATLPNKVCRFLEAARGKHRNHILFCGEFPIGSCGAPIFTTCFCKYMEESKISQKNIGTKLKFTHYIFTGVIVITMLAMGTVINFLQYFQDELAFLFRNN